jgi:hypothetical protein
VWRVPLDSVESTDSSQNDAFLRFKRLAPRSFVAFYVELKDPDKLRLSSAREGADDQIRGRFVGLSGALTMR